MKRPLPSSIITFIIFLLVLKVAGFFKEIVIATFFGAKVYTDMFFVALIPSVFATVLANNIRLTFVPYYKSLQEKSQYEARAFFKKNFLMSILVGGCLFLLCFFFPQLLVRLIAPGFTDEKILITAAQIRTLSFVPWMLMPAGVLMGCMYTDKKFIRVTIAEMSIFIVMILGIVIGARFLDYKILALSFLGGHILFFVLIITFAYGYFVRLPGGMECKTALHIGGFWFATVCLLLGGIYSMGDLFLDRFFASSMQVGSISSLSFSYKVAVIPVVTVGYAISQTSHTELSGHFVKMDIDTFKSQLRERLGTLIFLLIPFAVIMFAFSDSIIKVVYGYGKFVEGDGLIMTAHALKVYSFSTLFLGIVTLLSRTCIIIRANMYVLAAGVIGFLANVIASFLLRVPFSYLGLALGTLTGTVVVMIILAVKVHSVYDVSQRRKIFASVIKTSIAFVVLLGIGVILSYDVGRLHIESRVSLFVMLFIVSAVIFALYLALGYILKIPVCRRFVVKLRNILIPENN